MNYLARAFDEYIFRTFAAHGISREEVLGLLKEGRITVYHEDGFETFKVDGTPLFKIGKQLHLDCIKGQSYFEFKEVGL